MDLKSLMNNDGAEAARPQQQRPGSGIQQQQQHQHQLQLQQHAQSRPGPGPPSNIRTPSGSHASPSLQHQQHHHGYATKPTPPLYQHSASMDSRASNGAVVAPRLTPLKTPVQTPGQGPGPAGAGYPFPSGPYQSPSQGQQQYRGHDVHVATPGGASSQRPQAPLYQQQQQQQTASSPYLHHSPGHVSMSPTPPTLHGVRESPSSAGQPYGHAPYPIHGQHPSQPSTPLGYARPFAQPQSSPYAIHHRSSSGASHAAPPLQHPQQAPHPPPSQQHQQQPHPQLSMTANSPVQVMTMGNMIESPAAYGPPGQQLRRAQSGAYMSEADRERSVSVSPKTRIVPRQNSQGSFYSSHDPMSARNSISASQSEYDRASHQAQSQSQSQHEPQHLRSSGDMSHNISPLNTTRPAPSTSASLSHPAPSPSSRSSQTPKLHNLLNDPAMTLSPVRQSPVVVKNNNPPQRFPSQPQLPLSNGARPSYPSYEVPLKIDPSPRVKAENPGSLKESLLQQPVTAQTPAQAAFTPAHHPPTEDNHQANSRKRSAGSAPESAHPVKRARKRYTEPPIWARFDKSNPKFGNNPQSLAPPPQVHVKRLSPRPQIKTNAPTSQHQPQSQPPANGHQPHAMANGTSVAPQVNHHPMSIPRVGPWEVNVRNVQLMNDLTKEIGDFLFHHATRNDIGVGDVRSGTLEVEAKLGTLIDRNTNSRVATMGVTNMVLDHGITASGRLRFESFMTEIQHKQMNDFLNKSAQASMEPGRVRMGYKHRYERDSFASLNRVGMDALPQSAKAHLRPGHSLKLRTSVDTKAPKGSPQAILGRIVKVRLDDLDIHCPKMDFDCRISVNVEVDLNNRPDIDPSLIVDAVNPGDPEVAHDRMKDRLSYQHLAYSVDLTQVTGAGGKKTHELEIEVDTAKLREEATRLVHNQDSAYEAIVDGLLSNVFTLMKAQKEMGAR